MDYKTWANVKGDPEHEKGGVFYDEQYPSQGVVWQRWLIELNKPRDWGWGTEAQDDLKVKVQNVLKEPNTGDADKEKIKEALELIRSFEPLEEWRGQEDPETSEDLVREIKKILEK